MQALMLAAGMGKRLGKHTAECTKCMIEVGGESLFKRTCNALLSVGIKDFVVVVGFQAEKLMEYAKREVPEMNFRFVYNHNYATTNNIYSLYLAREDLSQDDTILIESDLIYDPALIKGLMESRHDNLAAVAKYEQWMDGTVALVDRYGNILDLIEKKDFEIRDIENYYKTVNIYKFSREFLNKQYIPFLNAYVNAYGNNQYYELVIKIIAHLRKARLKAYDIRNLDWYEIDDAQDLDIANTLFAEKGKQLPSYGKRYGGFWRFPRMTDFCYLVNPYFPPRQLMEKMKYFFPELVSTYPSGMYVQKIIAGKMFGLADDYMVVGNGAAEIIHALGKIISGRLAVSVPSFHEYIRCFGSCEIRKIDWSESDYRFDMDRMKEVIPSTDTLVIVNPDNPGGDCLTEPKLLEIVECCRQNNVRCIVDESFIDCADKTIRFTLLKGEVLDQYPNLVVVKSISKSYGVPGLRLGVAATSDRELLKEITDELPVWNINSFAEYFMQNFSVYKREFIIACNSLQAQRKQFFQKLAGIGYLFPYPSQANFIMCRVDKPYTSSELAELLIEKYNILIKDLSTKEGFHGKSYIRLAVRGQEDNDRLCHALKELEEEGGR